MTKKKVAIDDGHGMETAGKRTPPLPDGTIMQENEFNARVAELLTDHLTRCGIDVLLVAPGDTDIPLSVRTAAANREGADLYISIHANASGAGGSFNSARGIETYHAPGSVEGKRAAEIIHRHLMAGTKLPNRGVKSQAFYVLTQTRMPAVLPECGFMTNIEDAKLLLSEAYRAECAQELAQGVCEYLGVPYVEKPRETTPGTFPAVTGIAQVLVKGGAIEDGYLIGGRTYVPLRAIGGALGMSADWDAETRTARLEQIRKRLVKCKPRS